MTSPGQILNWCNGSWLQHNQAEQVITALVIDSRNIDNPGTALFIPLKTNIRDGHMFLNDAYAQGVRNFLVSQPVDVTIYPNANIIDVKDTLIALQHIAAAHRRQFHIPVIGITGSNGKTIIKEWLYQLLCDDYNIVRSPKSYNSQIGVPLSVWQMNGTHTLAIFEAGISKPGEMERLEQIISPGIGVFSNIGEAHSEGFTDTPEKIYEKLKLFRFVRSLVYCIDHLQVHEGVQHFFETPNSAFREYPVRLFTWSQKMPADLQVTNLDKQLQKTTVTASYLSTEIAITIPFTDDASVENAMQCWCVLLLLGVEQSEIKRRMLLLHPVSMRMELRHGINDCTIINDSYNSDLTSLALALNYLDQQKQHSLHTVIISDMLQMGRQGAELYGEVAELVSRRSIQRLIGIGTALNTNKGAFKKYKNLHCTFFKSTDDFLKKFHLLTFSKEAVLLKGARVFAFEKIALLMEQQVHQTVMNINLGALRHNLNYFRSLLAPGVKTMAMVKAFAYGSGSQEIAALLQYAGVDYLTVAYTDEGITLRKAGITMPVMVMSPDATSFSRMIAWKLEPEIYNFRTLESFIQIARTLNAMHYPIHIKLDTGMHRLGFEINDIEELAITLAASNEVKTASIFSHLAASDDPGEDDFTLQQAQLFNQMSRSLTDKLSYTPLLHLCNSAAIVRHHSLHYDMVRLGIGLYGVDTSHALRGNLEQISTLKTVIAQVTEVKAGENIGYGHKTIAPHDMRIATICIGYADGYPRTMGNGNAWVLILGKPAKITGNVCMDMCMADVTDIPDAVEGDEVIVMGENLPVTQLAAWADTIPYEIMTGVSQRVKRVYVNE